MSDSCDPMDCSLLGSSVHGISQGRIPELGCHFLLQEIVPTQGLNPGLPHCRQMLPSEKRCSLRFQRFSNAHRRSPLASQWQETSSEVDGCTQPSMSPCPVGVYPLTSSPGSTRCSASRKGSRGPWSLGYRDGKESLNYPHFCIF